MKVAAMLQIWIAGNQLLVLQMTRYIIIVQNRRSPSGGTVFTEHLQMESGEIQKEVVSSRVFTGMGEQGSSLCKQKRDLRI